MRGKSNHPTRIYWLTGLSGAGKSTLCRLLVEELRRRGRSVVMLDGDELRELMDAQQGHRRADRVALSMRYSRLCRMLARQGFDVAIATISLWKEVHEWNWENLPGYVEIYLRVPLDELQRRDPKGIYARASRGEVSNVAGVDLEVDIPQKPHVTITHRDGETAEQTLAGLLDKLQQIEGKP
jgi:adenylylsulfate kinase-like enzyme